jgi:hypothetical protein
MRGTDFPAGEPVKELTAQLITSLRLRGEVGNRAQREFRVRGKLFPHLRLLSSRE